MESLNLPQICLMRVDISRIVVAIFVSQRIIVLPIGSYISVPSKEQDV